MFTRALGGAVMTLASLTVVGCSTSSQSDGGTQSVQPDTYAEFFIESDGDFVFEVVDRSTPEPIEAEEGDECFTDPAWAPVGAPHERGDSQAALPEGVQRGEVNVMQQCHVPAGATLSG